jgi:hypothetical protein
VNKFAVLAASLVASFALAFAVYSAENKTNASTFPLVVASIRLTDQTQRIPNTPIFNVTTTGLYRVSGYMAMATPGAGKTAFWDINLSWTDEAGLETNANYTELSAVQVPPLAYAFAPYLPHILPPIPIEAVAGTPINYAVGGTAYGGGGTYELFMTVEQLQ